MLKKFYLTCIVVALWVISIYSVNLSAFALPVLQLKVKCYIGSGLTCKNLIKNGHVSISGVTSLQRVPFVETQRAVENAIYHYLKKHKLAKSYMVIHKDLPTTPLRFTKSELMGVSDMSIRKNIILRHKILLSLIDLSPSSVQFMSLRYLDTKDYLGYQNYQNMLQSHRNIIDFYNLDTNDENRYILGNGSTYVIIDGEKNVIFAIEEKQLYNGSSLSNFDVYYGSYESIDEKISAKVRHLIPLIANKDESKKIMQKIEYK